MSKVPKSLQGVLWSRDVKKLDTRKDKNYIIHQVLMYGSMAQIKWLKKVYPKKEIKDTFVGAPRKIYTKSSYNFVKNYLLGIDKRLFEHSYVKTTPRNIR